MKRFLPFLLLPFNAYALLNPPQYISFLPPGASEVLERENAISTLCPQKNNDELNKCKSEKLKPVEWTLDLYSEAASTSKKIGTLSFIATPGKGMSATFIDLQKKVFPYTPDTIQEDWGYSSYFVFTIADIKGDWIRLPKRPFSTPVWVNLKSSWPIKNPNDYLPTPTPVETEGVYTSKTVGDFVFLKFEGQTITYRKENLNDEPCKDKDRVIPAHELKEITRPLKDFFDNDEHITAWPKYPRGC